MLYKKCEGYYGSEVFLKIDDLFNRVETYNHIQTQKESWCA